MEKNNIITDWLDQHGDPERDKFVETQLTQNEMKQTAVEWLIDKYIIIGGITQNMVEQAKAMEKEQIIEAYRKGYIHYLPQVDSEDYYNKTFKLE